MDKESVDSRDHTNSIANQNTNAVLHFYQDRDDMAVYKAIVWFLFMGLSTLSFIISIWLMAFGKVTWPNPSIFLILVIIGGSLGANRTREKQGL